MPYKLYHRNQVAEIIISTSHPIISSNNNNNNNSNSNNTVMKPQVSRHIINNNLNKRFKSLICNIECEICWQAEPAIHDMTDRMRKRAHEGVERIKN